MLKHCVWTFSSLLFTVCLFNAFLGDMFGEVVYLLLVAVVVILLLLAFLYFLVLLYWFNKLSAAATVRWLAGCFALFWLWCLLLLLFGLVWLRIAWSEMFVCLLFVCLGFFCFVLFLFWGYF